MPSNYSKQFILYLDNGSGDTDKALRYLKNRIEYRCKKKSAQRESVSIPLTQNFLVDDNACEVLQAIDSKSVIYILGHGDISSSRLYASQESDSFNLEANELASKLRPYVLANPRIVVKACVGAKTVEATSFVSDLYQALEKQGVSCKVSGYKALLSIGDNPSLSMDTIRMGKEEQYMRLSEKYPLGFYKHLHYKRFFSNKQPSAKVILSDSHPDFEVDGYYNAERWKTKVLEKLPDYAEQLENDSPNKIYTHLCELKAESKSIVVRLLIREYIRHYIPEKSSSRVKADMIFVGDNSFSAKVLFNTLVDWHETHAAEFTSSYLRRFDTLMKVLREVALAEKHSESVPLNILHNLLGTLRGFVHQHNDAVSAILQQPAQALEAKWDEIVTKYHEQCLELTPQSVGLKKT